MNKNAFGANAREVAGMLAKRAESVAVYLLGSEGKRIGQELRFGDVNGQPGKSLGVHLAGDKAGVWADFESGESGDLLDLWAISRDCDLSQALMEAKEWLGISSKRLSGRQVKAQKIERPQGVAPLRAAEFHWLKNIRKISQESIAAYKIAACGNGTICFPYLLPDENLVAAKFRSIHEDKYWAEKGSSKVLFGWQAIPRNARSVVLCEGELKALAWWDYGFPALSVPFGGGGKNKQDWIEVEYDRLERFDLIYVAMDEDEPGQQAAEEIVRRLGSERCAIIKHPLPPEPKAKCINACLKHGVSRAAIANAVAQAKPKDPDELHSFGYCEDALVAAFKKNHHETGIRTPWERVGDSLVFRPGEFTVIAGINGHGKSQAAGFMAGYAMKTGHRVCMASLEFKVTGWGMRLCRQIGAVAEPSEDYIRHIARWLDDGRLWTYDVQGTTNWRRMLEVFRYARRRYDIHLFVIDNLTGLGIGEEDLQGQKEFALELSNFVRDEECHVWLVHHIRKGSSEKEQPDKMDIKGSGSITDLACTVLTVWRNKKKEEARQKAQRIGATLDLDTENAPDVVIKCSKQRNYGGNRNGEPSIWLYWDSETFQYLDSQNGKPSPLLPPKDRFFKSAASNSISACGGNPTVTTNNPTDKSGVHCVEN